MDEIKSARQKYTPHEPMAIMSVEEARKLLGKDAEKMSDEQVAELVEQTDELAKLALKVARDKVAREKYDERVNVSEKLTNL